MDLRTLRSLLGLCGILCSVNSSASILFYSDPVAFTAAADNLTLTNFEGLVDDGATLTQISFLLNGVSFATDHDLSQSAMLICGQNACTGNPFDSALLFDRYSGDTMSINLPASGPAVTAAGGLFGGIRGSAPASLNVFGPLGPLGTWDVTVGDMRLNQTHTFFGWIATQGDEISRIEFKITDGSDFLALDDFQHGSFMSMPLPAAAWLMGSGLLGIFGPTGKRRCN